MITPREVWEAWPDNDLLGIEPPEQDESYAHYRERIGEDIYADPLYFFALAELCESGLVKEEAAHRLHRGISDLTYLQKVLDL